MCVCARTRVCVHVCVCTYVCARVCVHMCVHAYEWKFWSWKWFWVHAVQGLYTSHYCTTWSHHMHCSCSSLHVYNLYSHYGGVNVYGQMFKFALIFLCWEGGGECSVILTMKSYTHVLIATGWSAVSMIDWNITSSVCTYDCSEN